MNNSSILKFEGKEVRTVVVDGEVFFVAKDVFEALGIVWKGSYKLELVPDSWKKVLKLGTSFGDKDTHVINFKAVTKIAFRSNKPYADEFTNRAAEIVDNVAKTGMHIQPSQSVEDLIIMQAQSMKELRGRVNQLEGKQGTLESEVAEVRLKQEKAERAETITDAEQSAIKGLVSFINKTTGIHYQTIYSRLNSKFDIPKYSRLPRSHFIEAKLFLQNWRDYEIKKRDRF